MSKLRTFIAVDLPEEVIDKTQRLVRELDAISDGINWVEPENIHLTLKFLGEVRENETYRVCQATSKAVADIQAFGDRIAALLDGEEVSQEEIASVVRDLPCNNSFDVGDVTITDVEATLVVPQRSAGRVVARELAACGYRVSTVLDPVEALEVILDTRPDFVITAMVMPRMSGVDLACALGAMPATRTIPVALLTSLEPGHEDLKPLPINTGIIRRGAHFGDDLANVLERFGIT